jgi:hypothetical protein
VGPVLIVLAAVHREHDVTRERGGVSGAEMNEQIWWMICRASCASCTFGSEFKDLPCNLNNGRLTLFILEGCVACNFWLDP